ncbi:MAG: hypothetical protein Q4G58_03545 [bacterium]|nr:hypothetical protein [bacterium]
MSIEFRYDQFGIEQKIAKPVADNKEIANASTLTLPDNYIVLGMVKTGDNLCFDQMIEVSAVKYKNSQEIARFSELIRPEDYYLVSIDEMEKKEDYCIVDGGPVQYVQEKFTLETGITNQMLYHAENGSSVCHKLKEFIGDHIILGDGISLQLQFLNRQSELTFENDYIELMGLAKRARKENYALSILDLAILYEIPYGNSKRAEQLCQLTSQVYERLRDDLIEKFGTKEQFEQSMTPVSVSYPEYVDTQVEGKHPFYNKVCVFTGTLTKMVRGNAMRIVRNCGGITGTSVTKKTQYLILGNKEYEQRLQGNKSTKLRRAEALIQEGAPLHIISEDAFYELVGLKNN